MENGSDKHNYTFDTCVGIKVCENPNIGNLLSCRINFESSEIHLSSQTSLESHRLGYDIDDVSKQLKESIGVKIVFGRITRSMFQDAKYLETKCPTLHVGDSEILAYARATNTVLVTCDRGLEEAATLSGTRVINPNLLACDKIGLRKSKTKMIIHKAIRKPHEAKQKIKSFATKPGQKIFWRSFQ